MKTTCLLILTFLATGCSQWRVEEDFATVENYVAIYGVLCPEQDTTRIYVSKMYSLGEYDITKLDARLSDAIVFLEKNGERHSLNYDTKSKAYCIANAALNIGYGQEYELQVSRANQTYKAKCRIPLQVENPSLAVVNQDKRLSITYEFQHNSLSPAYYKVKSDLVFDKVAFTTVAWDDNRLNNLADVIEVSGKELQSFMGVIDYSDARNPINTYKTGVVSMALFSIDENLKNYFQSLSSSNDLPDGNLEFMEKFITRTSRFSTFENAAGFFGAYSRKDTTAYIDLQ